jgi:tape measure domain-containing protein
MADRTITTRMRVEYKQAVDGFNAVGSSAGRAANEVDKAAQKLTVAEKSQQRAARAAERRASQSETAIQKMSKYAAANEEAWTTAGTALTVAGGAILGFGLAAGKAGIEFNSLKQTAGAALKSVTGSADSARRQMDKLNEFGSKSWVMRDVLIRSQQAMAGFGVETQKIIPYLDGLQEAVAAAGGSSQTFEELAGVMAKVKSQGKITAETFNEFGTRGVDAATIIGEQMGMTGQEIRDSVTAGTLDADKALDALAKGMKTKFDGATENLRNTFRGAMDNLSAAWRDLSASMAEPIVGPDGGGLAVAGLNGLADALVRVKNVADEMPNGVKATGLVIGGLAGATSLAAGGFLALAPRIVETQKAFSTLAGQDDLVGKVARGMQSLKGPMLAIAKFGGTAVVLGGITTAIAEMVEGNKLDQAQQGSKQVAIALEDLKKSADGLDRVFQLRDGSALTSDIDSLGEALDRTFNRSWDQRFNDWGESIIQKFTNLRGESGVLADGFSSIDTELANLVDGGKADEAAAAFEKIRVAAEQQDVGIERLKILFPEYADAVEAAGESAAVAAAGIGEMSPKAVEASQHLQEVKDQLTESADGFLNFSEKATDAKVSLQAWIDDMGKQVEAQEQWFDNLGSLMERGAPQEFIDFLMSLGPEGAKRVKQLADASDTELQRAINKFTEGKTAAGEFANEVLGIPNVDLDADASKLKTQVADAKERLDELRKLPTTPEIDAQITLLEEKVKQGRKKLDDLEKKKTKPKIDADTKPAKSDVEAFDKWLEERKNPLINIDAKVRIINDGQIRNMPETLLNPNRKQVRAPGVEKRAAGGPIFGPGSGTSDDIPAWLSNGEHVWTAEEVRKAGGHSAIEALRQAAKSGMLGFAKGGTVGAAERRVDSANTSLKSARRRKQDARSKSAKAVATRAVRAAEDELDAARKSLKAAKSKASSDAKAAREADRKAKAAKREADRKAAEAKREAERKAKEERERKARVNDLRGELRTDVRRGDIRDQVTSGLSGGYSAVDRLFDLGGNKDLSKASRSRANTSARRFEANLKSLYSQAEKIDEKLKKAQDKATELKGIKDGVTSSLLGGRGVDVGDYQNFENGQWSTYSGVAGATRRMTADVGAMKAFAGKLKKLAAKGIPGAIIQEIAQAGVAEGSTMADAFLDASDAEVKSYVGAWKDYEKYAGQAGQYVTEGFYSGGSAAADGVVKGLEGRKKNVESAIANLAKAMESTFKQVLGIHSPSRVMSELGGFTAEGLVQGMLGGVADVQSAAAALGSAAVPNMMGLAPSDMSMDVGVSPVVSDDEGMAGLAMQDMSTTTLEAMAAMGLAVSDGFAGMLANTQAAQAQMLLDTQLNQDGMLTATQASNLGQLTDTQTQQAAMLLNTQTQQAAMLLNTQTQNANMLLDTQTQQEAMRSTVQSKQTGQRTAAETQQELMRLMLIDKQSQMKTKSATDFEELKNTTGSKFSSMRTNTDTTMGNIYSDYDTRLADLKGLNKRGFESIVSTSNKNMEAVRDGIDGQMAAAKPEMGNRLNSLIGVLSKFTASVNKAFGDVGVEA